METNYMLYRKASKRAPHKSKFINIYYEQHLDLFVGVIMAISILYRNQS